MQHDPTNALPNATDLEAWGTSRFLNRELGWLEFNRRVLGEALEERHPLLERVKFLAIFATNLDEFFMVRVASIHKQIAAGVISASPDGVLPTEQLARIKPIVEELTQMQRRCWHETLLPQLRAYGIDLRPYADLDAAEREIGHTYFREQIFPVLTPLAFDAGHPFPFISNVSLNLAVVIDDPDYGERFARVKVPGILPRLIPITRDEHTVYVWLEDAIAAHVSDLFPGVGIAAVYPFRVVRDTDVALQEDEATDLLSTIEDTLRQRQFGPVVRLSVERSLPERILNILIENLEISSTEVYRVQGQLGLAGLMEVAVLPYPELKDPPLVQHVPPGLTADHDLFAAIRDHDVLLHHPYDSFMPVVQLLDAAADDPQVLAIKQTLYRVGRKTPIVEALMRARQNDKQVTVLVELKARFDEEPNIEWARQLEDAGVHVVYGLVGLKTHGKVLLIVRKEGEHLRRYVHLSTGNYNVATAKIYTDLGLLTCDPTIGADASTLFNALTGYVKEHPYHTLTLAPARLRHQLYELIEREIAHHQAYGSGVLILKTNTLTDTGIIDALYKASQAGVSIDLIVRGVCCLRPGVRGLSETIRVRSIIGRFLEHSRIYYFGNNGQPEVYLSSADLMRRNLDRRVEVLFPIQQPSLVRQLHDDILNAYVRDTANAHVLHADGSFTRADAQLSPFDAQATFLTTLPAQLD